MGTMKFGAFYKNQLLCVFNIVIHYHKTFNFGFNFKKTDLLY